jgi:uncharacterized protein YjbI with pentapeptide repeats
MRSSDSAVSLRGVEVSRSLWELLIDPSLESQDIRPSVSCGGASFLFRPQLRNVRFLGHVELVGAEFGEGIEVDECNFERGLSIDFADMGNGPGHFMKCDFGPHLLASYTQSDQQQLAFVQCTVTGPVLAEGCIGDLRFDGCDVKGDFGVPSSELHHLSLASIKCARGVDLDGLHTKSMRAPDFEALGATSIGALAVEGYCDLTGATFGGRVHLDVSAERVDLVGATFQSGGRVEVRRAAVDLKRVVLGAQLTLVGHESASLLSIGDADAAMLSLSALDLSRCTFQGSHGLEQLQLESTRDLPVAPRPFRTRRRSIADEHAWRARNSRVRRPDWKIPGTDLVTPSTDVKRLVPLAERTARAEPVSLPTLTAAQVSATYRALRKGLESRSNEPGAADFYYGEMEMRLRDATTSRAERVVIFLYWLTSGYGLRAARSLLCLGVVCAVGAVALHQSGLATPDATLGDALLSALQAALPGVAVDEALTNAGQVVDLVLSLLGPVLLGLFALALRNRVAR